MKVKLTEETIDFVFDLLKTKGSEYCTGEAVSITDHMIQTAMQAEKFNQPPRVIIASLLHDIGTLVKPGDSKTLYVAESVDIGPEDHDLLGGEFLKGLGFPEDIYRIARDHVNALKYMVYMEEENYKKKLSWAAQLFVREHAEPLSPEKAREFETLPHFNLLVEFRNWDEAGKDPNCHSEPLEKYRKMAKECLLVEKENTDD